MVHNTDFASVEVTPTSKSRLCKFRVLCPYLRHSVLIDSFVHRNPHKLDERNR